MTRWTFVATLLAAFTSFGAPILTSFTPTAGSLGTAVTITGTNLQTVTELKLGSVTTPFTIVSPTTITTTVPDGALSGVWVAGTSTGSSSNTSASFTVTSAAAPVISSFTPTSGLKLSTVYLTGSNFMGTSAVKVNGTSSSFKVVKDSQLQVTVASNTSGLISVTNTKGAASSTSSFTVVPNPTITSFTPTTGLPGTTVTIVGTGFDEVASISLGTKYQSIVTRTATSMTFKVDWASATGTLVLLDKAGTNHNAGTFTVDMGPTPTVTSFTPTADDFGSTVTVFGTNFYGINEVLFSGTKGNSLIVDSNDRLRVTVPPLASSGPITVRKPHSSATSTASFTVTETITVQGFSPLSGTQGTPVTITGAHFTGASKVLFGDKSAPFSIDSDTQITAAVPSGSVPSLITVEDAHSTGKSTSKFTVTSTAAPVIIDFDPRSASSQTVRVLGAHFTGLTGVSVGGVPSGSIAVLSDVELTFIPLGPATTNSIVVTNSAGSATSAGVLTIYNRPTITSFSPTEGPVGTVVSITGTDLDRVTQVLMGNDYPIFSVESATHMSAQIQGSSSTGTIRLLSPAGFASSSSPFTLLASGIPSVASAAPSIGFANRTSTLFGNHFATTSSVTVGGVSVPFKVISEQQLAIIPNVAVSGSISVTNGAGTGNSSVSYTASLALEPQIVGINPSSAVAGSTVVISGSNLSTVQSVRFEGVEAEFSSVTDTAITAVVPLCQTGQVLVTTSSGNDLASFTCLPSAVPTISGFAPLSAWPESLVTLTGTNLKQVTEIKIGGIQVPVTMRTDDAIWFRVPNDASTGLIEVINALGTATSTQPLVVLPFIKITGYSPQEGPPGTKVTVTGTNFEQAFGVTVGDASASFVVVDAQTLTFTVPINARTGTLRVIAENANGPYGGSIGGPSTSSLFVVLPLDAPSITSISPTQGGPGSTIFITGKGLSGITTVRLGAILLSVTPIDDSLLSVTVSSAARSGKITVINALGTATSNETFSMSPAPRITSTSPFEGSAGDTVTLKGSGLSSITQVLFGASTQVLSDLKEAPFTVVSDNELTTVVPSGARSRITLSGTSGQTSTPFGVKGVLPTITRFSPTEAVPSTQVVVEGTGFTGTQVVLLAGFPTAFTVLSDTRLRFQAGSSAWSQSTAQISVITSGGTGTSAALLKLIPPLKISLLSPNMAVPGEEVRLVGTGLSTATSLDFEGAPAPLLNVSDTSITTTMPLGAVRGVLHLRSPYEEVTFNFQIKSQQPPVVTDFTPKQGGVDTNVVLTGSGFAGATLVLLNGNSVPFTVVSDTQLNVKLSWSLMSGPFTVVNSAGSAQSSDSFTVALMPLISFFSPQAGSLGQKVSVEGKNFTGASQVRFGNKLAAFTVVSDTKLTTRVPAGASTSALSITTQGGSNATSAFLVLAPTAPTLTGFLPISGGPGTMVTITGAHFTGVTAVAFNGVPASVVDIVSDTTLKALVPEGVTNGAVTVGNPAGTATSAVVFTVVEVPRIDSASPLAGEMGAAVTLVGARFTAVTGVRFNGVEAAFTLDSPTQLSTNVPPGATSGPISLVTAAGSTTSTFSFEVLTKYLPSIANFSPTVGPPGTEVTVMGNHFTGVQKVTFGSAPAAFTVVSDAELRATVPVGATSGILSISNAVGTALTVSAFEVTTPPRIDDFSPRSGRTGDVIAITGIDFTGTTAVKFNGVDASFTVESDTHLTATVPSGTTTGLVSVVGVKGTGRSDLDFIVLDPQQPVLSSISPTFGSTAGGTLITLSGMGFANGATVKFGSVAVVDVTSVDATSLQVVSPPLGAGTVDVEVLNPDGLTTTLSGAFTAIAPQENGGISAPPENKQTDGTEAKSCGCSTSSPLDIFLLMGALGLFVVRQSRRKNAVDYV